MVWQRGTGIAATLSRLNEKSISFCTCWSSASGPTVYIDVKNYKNIDEKSVGYGMTCAKCDNSCRHIDWIRVCHAPVPWGPSDTAPQYCGAVVPKIRPGQFGQYTGVLRRRYSFPDGFNRFCCRLIYSVQSGELSLLLHGQSMRPPPDLHPPPPTPNAPLPPLPALTHRHTDSKNTRHGAAFIGINNLTVFQLANLEPGTQA